VTLLNCMHIQCIGMAEFSVKALVPACDHEFYECAPIEVYCGLRLCAAHAAQVKVIDIFSDELRDNVIQMMMHQHHVMPDFARSLLQVISINDLQLLMLESRHATIH
jgi:hypothetical protein